MAQLTNQATPTPTPTSGLADSATPAPTPTGGLTDSATPTPHPAAVQLANNLDALTNNGHTYLGIPAQVALASGGQSVPQTLAIADHIKSSIQSNNAVVDSFYTDPAQNTYPTLSQQIVTTLHAVVGGKPVMGDHVGEIQKQMQAAGVGVGLSANSIWTPDWQKALVNSQATSLQKPGVGNADSKSTIHHILSFLTPSHVGNFLINTAKALPRETLQAMGDVIYGVVSGGSDPNAGKAVAQFGAKPENRTTTQQFVHQAVSPEQQIQDLGTMLQFLPIAKLVSGTAGHIAEARIASDIAKNTVKNTFVEKAMGATRLTALQQLDAVAPKYTLLKSIVTSAQAGTPGLMDLSDSALLSRPVMRWVFPKLAEQLSAGIAKTAPIQMAVRDIMAQRLRLPVVQATNAIGLGATGAALKLGAIATAESQLGGRGGTLDQTVYAPGPISGTLATALNLWGMQLNPGRTGAGEILGTTGQAAQDLRDTFTDTGALHAFTNANPQIDFGKLVADHGLDAVHQFVGNQLNQIAAAHAADFQLNPLKADPNGWANMTGLEKIAKTQATQNEIWRTATAPDSALNLSYQHIVTDMNAMETGFRNIGLSAAEDTRSTAYANPYEVSPLTQKQAEAAVGPRIKKASTLDNAIRNQKVLNKLLEPENQQYLVHPGTLKTLAQSQKEFYDSQALAESDALHEPTSPDAVATPDPKVLESAQADYAAKKTVNDAAAESHAKLQDAFNKPNVSASDVARAKNQMTKARQTLQEATEENQKKAQEAFDVRNNIYKRLQDQFKNPPPAISKADLNRSKVSWTTARQDLNQSSKAVDQAQSDIKVATKANAQAARAKAGVSDIAKPTNSSAWLEENNPQAPDGMIGWMRKNGLASQDNKRLVAKLQSQFDEAVASKKPEKLAKVRTAVAHALLNDHAVDITTLGEHDTQSLIGILEDQTKDLASNIYATADAPDHIKALLNELDANGGKLVAGTDIGHAWTKPLFRDLGSEYEKSNAAQFATKLGLSPKTSTSEAVSARSQVETLREIQNAIDDGRIDALPGMNASRLQTWLKQELPSTLKLTLGQGFSMRFGKAMGNYDLKIAKLMKADPTLTSERAWADIQEAKKLELGMREINPNQLRAALMKEISPESADLLNLPKGTPFLDKDSANQFIQALWRGRLNVPSDMIGGLAKVEDWLYAGLGVGNVSFAGVNGMKLAELPSRFFNIRSRIRYQESLMFAYRRMFKTMAKGITENIPPTMYPEAKMDEMGITSQADAIHRRIFPEDNVKNAFLDDAERVVSEGDLYNLYSPRDSARWASYWLQKQGFSDEQIRQKISNVMDYGNRTAAERSLNAVFFPFSFNKTVMRQFGGFLMTHPGQRMILSTLMDQFDKHGGPDALAWLETHAPVIKEIEKLNAFEHGIGLGQAGGINSPYFQGLAKFITLFGPKRIDYGSSSKNDQAIKTLKQYIPLLKEFTDLFIDPNTNHLGGQVGDTFGNTWAGITTDIQKYAMHSQDTDWSPIRHTSMGYSLQQSEGWAYRSRMITMLSKVLDYNYANPNTRKGWPNWVPQNTGLWGKPITKSSIGELVHYKYPAWDNTATAVISQQKATEADRFIGETSASNPNLGAAYRVFDTKAKQVSDAVGRDSVKPDKLAVLTDEFRKVAVQLSLQDPNFKGFYKTHYERLFGPLEVFSQ